MIIEKIQENILAGMIIPKPNAKGQFIVKGWGRRRNQFALIYTIPNHKNPIKPYQKGITESEFSQAFSILTHQGEFTRKWFNSNMPPCAKEGGCNFTTIGGIFELLGVTQYKERGVYARKLN